MVSLVAYDYGLYPIQFTELPIQFVNLAYILYNPIGGLPTSYTKSYITSLVQLLFDFSTFQLKSDKLKYRRNIHEPILNTTRLISFESQPKKVVFVVVVVDVDLVVVCVAVLIVVVVVLIP